MRIVLDTNVVVSAALFDGPPRPLGRLLRHPRFEVWTSRPLLAELAHVPVRQKLQRAVAHTGRSPAELVAAYVKQARVVTDAALPLIAFPPDPGDAHVIAAARASQARWLVTGDHHLLEAPLDLPCEVLTVAEALLRVHELLRQSRP
jgi:putative PIN family toxin of toxin-antitoxin system